MIFFAPCLGKVHLEVMLASSLLHQLANYSVYSVCYRSKLHSGWNFFSPRLILSFLCLFMNNQGQRTTKIENQPTIRDKTLGTVVQFKCFLTQAKLYLRTPKTVRPYPPPPTPQTVLKPSRHNSFDLSTLYWVRRGEGTWICKKTALLFAT